MAEAASGNRPTAWTYVDGAWREGDTPLFGAMTHAVWLGSSVFDGARAFEGVTPDLEAHCARTVGSAETMGLRAPVSAGEMREIAEEGLGRFPSGAELYIRPMVWAEEGGAFMIAPDADSSRFAMTLWTAPMPTDAAVERGFSITTTRYRRPTLDCAPVDAKAGCLYPNNGRMLREVKEKGFDNAIVLDALGNVAELATANVFLVKDGVVATPAPNGTFLNGLTRQRVIGLLRSAGRQVEERTLSLDDFRVADEVFATGNYIKVMPVTRFDDRVYPTGPVTRQARALYWDFAHGRST